MKASYLLANSQNSRGPVYNFIEYHGYWSLWSIYIKLHLLNEFHNTCQEVHFRKHILEQNMSERLIQTEYDVISIYFNLSVSHSFRRRDEFSAFLIYSSLGTYEHLFLIWGFYSYILS